MAKNDKWIDGEVLDEKAPGPNEREERREGRPRESWVARNRGFIEQGKTLAQTALVVSPPPARLALAALSVAADGLLLADDMRTGKIDRSRARLRAGGIALEGVALLAASRLAPAILARNQLKVNQIRNIIRRMETGSSKTG